MFEKKSLVEGKKQVKSNHVLGAMEKASNDSCVYNECQENLVLKGFLQHFQNTGEMLPSCFIEIVLLSPGRRLCHNPGRGTNLADSTKSLLHLFHTDTTQACFRDQQVSVPVPLFKIVLSAVC